MYQSLYHRFVYLPLKPMFIENYKLVVFLSPQFPESWCCQGAAAWRMYNDQLQLPGQSSPSSLHPRPHTVKLLPAVLSTYFEKMKTTLIHN